jgi:hypothetical protein
VRFRHLKAQEAEGEGWKGIVGEGLALINRAPDDLHRFAQGLRLQKRAEMTDRKLREVGAVPPDR